MIIIDSLNQINTLPNSVVALGNFDGVHIGHQKLIERAVLLAKEENLSSVVFTFSELPINAIKGNKIIKNILTSEDKTILIEALGVDYLVCVPFDKDIQTTKPEEFAKNILVNKLNCKFAVCGFNYSFGYMGAGTSESLISYGKELGFNVDVINEIKIDNKTVSSTLIRQCLLEGDVAAFQKFTGRPYQLTGKVIEGNHLGTRMGFPTINLNLDNTMALPKNGVYSTDIFIEDDNGNELNYSGITNVGNKPTVGTFDKNAETYIFDYSGNLYGKKVNIYFKNFIREEKKFENIEELEKQIALDIQNAK